MQLNPFQACAYGTSRRQEAQAFAEGESGVFRWIYRAATKGSFLLKTIPSEVLARSFEYCKWALPLWLGLMS